MLNHEAVYALYSSVHSIDANGVARDIDGNEVTYDINAVNVKAQELVETQAAAQTAKAAAANTAISKLTALGLTADEIAALRGQ